MSAAGSCAKPSASTNTRHGNVRVPAVRARKSARSTMRWQREGSSL